MKKILIPLLILLFTLPALSQTGTGWAQYRTKANFRDSTYHYRDANFYGTLRVREGYVRIGVVTVTANGQELNILDGALVSTTELNRLVGVTSNVQTQLNTKAPIANPQFTGVARLSTDTLATKAYVRQQGGMGSEEVADQINDSLNYLKANALDITPYVWLKTDTGYTYKQVITFNQLQAFTGSGSGINIYELNGKVGVTSGFPGVGDSIISHSAFANFTHLLVYRNGILQPYNGHVPHNTVGNGYVLDQEAEQIIVRPVLESGEYVQIHAYPAIYWNSLVPEGAGGSSPLLDSLVAYWRCEEIEGPYINDEVAGYIGTGHDARVSGPGKIGAGIQFDYDRASVTVPYTAALSPTTNLMSISVWFYCDSLPTEYGHAVALFTLFDGSVHNTSELYISHETGYENKVIMEFMNSTGSTYAAIGPAISKNTWYHAVGVCNGDNKAVQLYVNGTPYNGNTFSGSLLHSFDQIICIGNENVNYLRGGVYKMDGICYSKQAFTAADVALLYRSGTGRTYPFN